MLVVIAIIAILSSLLMPGMISAVSTAKLTGCSNNLKQLFISFTQYENDFHYLPAPCSYAGVSGNYRYWTGKLSLGGYLEVNGDSYWGGQPK